MVRFGSESMTRFFIPHIVWQLSKSLLLVAMQLLGLGLTGVDIVILR